MSGHFLRNALEDAVAALRGLPSAFSVAEAEAFLLLASALRFIDQKGTPNEIALQYFDATQIQAE